MDIYIYLYRVVFFVQSDSLHVIITILVGGCPGGLCVEYTVSLFVSVSVCVCVPTKQVPGCAQVRSSSSPRGGGWIFV